MHGDRAVLLEEHDAVARGEPRREAAGVADRAAADENSHGSSTVVHYRADVFDLQHFPNGTRLLTAAQADAQSTCVMVMYAVGSRYEDDATGGISHFAEHLFFKGTERRPTARQIATEIDGIGAEFNAFTGKEYTGYYVKCAKEHVPVAIDVLGDMLLHSLFDPEEIEREKGVIVEEMNMYLDTPTSYLPSVYDRLCYGDTPLGRDIIGTPETVRAATRETFTNHLGRWYVPSRTVIGLGGAVTDAARAAVEELFGSLPAAESPDPEPWTPQPAPARAHPPQGVGLVPHPHRRRRPAAAAPRPLRGLGARGRARRRHVVAPLHRGARAPRAGLLHRRPARPVRRGRLALLAGRRRPQARRRGRLDDRGRAAAASSTSASPRTSSRRPATCSRAASCSGWRIPARSPRSGCAARSSKASRARSPRSWPASTQSPPTTSDGVANDLLAPDKLRLAAIGPFEDEARFEALLG